MKGSNKILLVLVIIGYYFGVKGTIYQFSISHENGWIATTLFICIDLIRLLIITLACNGDIEKSRSSTWIVTCPSALVLLLIFYIRDKADKYLSD